MSFLGGLGEIGRNCAVLETEGRLLMIDCGLMFPDSRMPGVDLVLPDFSSVIERQDDLEAIVITHGHEDHMGALAYLLRDVEAPVYGSAATLALAESRLEEAGEDLGLLHAVGDGEVVELGPFTVEFIPVTHSVPHGFALAITTPQGVIFHTGDFKLDPSPIDGRRTNVKRIREISKKPGIRWLLSDSTNAEEEGKAESESQVGKVLSDLFTRHPEQRIVVACFASHLHRVQQVIWAAEANGRKVATLGRSMMRNVAIGNDMGLIKVKPNTLIQIEDIDRYPDNEICVLSTGSQGEPLSALSLLAADENKWLSVDGDDLVIMSSHVIPGNEANVYDVIDGLYRRGAEVIYADIAPVHTTGHAKREELREMLNAVRPEFFVPVHGEYRHLVQHQRLAVGEGVDPNKAFVAEDGDVLELTDDGLRIADSVSSSFVYVDGLTDDITQMVLRDRRVLAEEGVVIVVVTIEAKTGNLEARPEVITRGWTYSEEADELLEGARQAVRKRLEPHLRAHPDIDTLKQDIRRGLGKFVNEQTGRRPMIVPIIMET